MGHIRPSLGSYAYILEQQIHYDTDQWIKVWNGILDGHVGKNNEGYCCNYWR